MIRHRPAGRGNPYLTDPDQRVPLRPVAGAPFELRATTAVGEGTPVVEIATGGEIRRLPLVLRGDAVPEADLAYGTLGPRRDDAGTPAGRTRAGVQAGRTSWGISLPPLGRGEHLRYRFAADGRRTAWHEVRGCAWSPAPDVLQVTGGAADRLVGGSTLVLDDGERAYAVRFALELRDGERIVGFGERFDAVDQRGNRLLTAVFDQFKGQGARSYLPMPFAIVVGGGFGFHVDTFHRVRFDVGASDPSLIQIEVELEPGAEHPELVVHLDAGDPASVLRSFLERTGVPACPPDWVHGLWMSGNEWNTQARVLAEVERSRELGIPVQAVVIEAWSDESTFVAFNGARYPVHEDGAPYRLADFEFPEDGPWPDPQGMVETLHELGIKVLLWQIPLVPQRPGQAAHDRDALLERGHCVRLADGSPYFNRMWWFPRAVLPDFTHAEAREWWISKRRYLVDELGIDGFKTDGGEHLWGHDIVLADGTRGGAAANRFPVAYAAAYHELLPGIVTFSRAGYVGSAAFPCHWAGDEDSTWEAFRSSLRAGITAGASGIFFWAWDLAGFAGPLPSAELYLRAAAAACFCPIMQYHSEFDHHRTPPNDRTPWNVAERTGDERVVPVFRRYARLRARLAPFVAEAARQAITDRKPLMRALWFDVPGEEAWQYPEQFLLGDDVVVAPVTAPGAEQWDVYVPPGRWIDAWTGEEHDGGRVLARPVPIDEIPVYVRVGRGAVLDLFHEVED
jgi:alpha-glucosidase (family GH31 glycosyl hydrolase)